MAAPCVDYTIGGVKIQFPCKAYPSQLAMMNHIVRGLNNSQHCLLESPTGSGKSLALLCSTLGWQQAQYYKQQHGVSQEEKEKSGGVLKKPQCLCICHNQTNKSPLSPACPVIDLTQSPCKQTPPTDNVSPAEGSHLKRQSIASRLSEKLQSSLVSEAGRDDDFQPDRKRIRTAEIKSRKKPRLEKGVIFVDDDDEFENHTVSDQLNNTTETSHSPPACPKEVCSKCPCDLGEEVTQKKPKVPKIFFGTRTHKQIKQIAHELKRTQYCSVPMTILSSREHSCVNPGVAPHANRNERCKDLRENKDNYSCRFYHNVHKMRDQSSLQWVHGLKQAWDIEELVSLGRRLKACSYYAARELMASANIVFCPYNYLLDPLIRESMDIHLEGQILVLDEAHNIEDCARESASYTLDLHSLTVCKDELESMIRVNIRRTQHEPLRDFCYSLINWIQSSQSLMTERGYESSSKEWSGKEVVDIFKDIGITPDTFSMLESNLMAVMEREERVNEDTVELPTISSASSTVLKSVFMVLDYLYRDKCRFADDYRVALQKSYTWTTQAPPDVPDANGYIVRRHRGRQNHRVKTQVLSLSFWCLNPAVAFSDLSGSVHSIVLTSGTLSPMDSFSSELGVKFTIQLEAPHVINKSQVWVGTVGAGPQGRKLCATFRNVETYTFQDEIGELLLHVCKVTAKGVLCFLTSYNMLDKLRDRWINTGLWEKLESLKVVITEPRGGGAKGDFDELLQTYYDAIKYCDNQRDGALLMAVCRGKVSEGLDFTDDNARAVVTVGIPYPNFKDLQVELKMKYNDQHSKTRGLLSGHDWYEIQAYRALNQALGRCIRHKNDWGALVLVDDRYKNDKYIKGLSKWVRQLAYHHDTFSGAMQSLVAFSNHQKIRTDGGSIQNPCIPSPNSNTSLSKEALTPKSVDNTSDLHKSPPAIQTKQEVNGETDVLKTEHRSAPFEPKQNPKKPCQPVYPIFTSSPMNPCFRKSIFKEKDASSLTHQAETSTIVDASTSRQPLSPIRDHNIDISATNSEHKMQNHIETKTTNGKEHVKSSDEEDETIFFTPELFEDGSENGSPQKDPCSPKNGTISERYEVRDVNIAGQSADMVRTEETGKDLGKEGGEEEEEEEEGASESREGESKLRRLSRSKKGYSSVQGVGRVRSSQRIRDTTKADTKMEINHKPNRKVSKETHKKQNKSDIQVEKCSKKTEKCEFNGKRDIDYFGKVITRKNIEQTPPKCSQFNVFDIVTPTKQETGSEEREEAAILKQTTVKSQEAKQKAVFIKVIKIQRSCKQNRRQQRASQKRKKAKDPCCLGLHCCSCGFELLQDAQGALKRQACEAVDLSLLQKYKLKSSKMSYICKCGPQKPLQDKTLLVISKKDLNKSLQPYGEKTQTGYNAIWDPSVGSVTMFLQCKGCFSKAPESVRPIAAKIHFPKDGTQEQMWLSPAAVWCCSQIPIDS